MLGMNIGKPLCRSLVSYIIVDGGDGGSVSVPITAVATNGWQVTYPSPPTEFDPAGSPVTFNASRAGYTTAASTTTYTEAMTVTKRLRQVHPNQASLTTDQAVLQDYLYSTDSVSGATNNSSETSPKPIVNWVTLDRTVVGNTLTAEVVCFHRNARSREQIACVEFRVSDGTTTLTQVVSESIVSGRTNDRNAVVVYRCSIDVSTLANPSTLTLNAKVYPWIGETGSVLDSADQSARREFSPRTFRRNTTLAASPVFVYVAASGGDDVNGVVSTTAATAKATPCATIGGALNRLVAVNGSVDGCEIRLLAGTHTLNSTGVTTTRTQSVAHVTITRDPDEILSAVTLQYGGVAFRPRLGASGGWLTIRDITTTRPGTTQLTGETGSQLEVRWQDCPFDNESRAVAIVGGNADLLLIGNTFTNMSANATSAGTREIRLIRGCSGTLPAIEGWLVVGNSMSIGQALGYGTRTATGSICAYNTFTVTNSSQGGYSIASSVDVNNAACVQNIWEYTSATSGPAIRVSADSASGNTSHIVLHHNTFAGFFLNGRMNGFYDDGVTARTNKLMSCKGNIHVQLNTKSDVFQADGSRIGNWAYENGVGCEGEFSQFIDADSGGIGSGFAQDYPGLRASIGTSSSVRNDPLFIDDNATSSGPTAGSGGGNYRLNSGSPADTRVAPVLRFDLDGNARSATLATSGAYEL